MEKAGEDLEIAKSFFAEEEGILSDLAGNCNFSFKRGNNWAIDPGFQLFTLTPLALELPTLTRLPLDERFFLPFSL